MQRRNGKRNSGVYTAAPNFPYHSVLLKRRGESTSVQLFAGSVTLRGHPDLQYDYDVEVAVADEPAPHAVVAALTVRARSDDRPVVARRVAQELGMVRLQAFGRLAFRVDEGGRTRLTGRPRGADVRAAVKAASQGRSPVDDRELRAAAKAYKMAQRGDGSTTRAVSLALGVSASTARKRVMRARAAGYLPPATSTRPKV